MGTHQYGGVRLKISRASADLSARAKEVVREAKRINTFAEMHVLAEKLKKSCQGKPSNSTEVKPKDGVYLFRSSPWREGGSRFKGKQRDSCVKLNDVA